MTFNKVKWLTQYFNVLSRFEELEWDCLGDGIKYKKIQEKRTFKFLVGLNKNLDKVCGWILGIKPLHAIQEAFSEVRRKESWKKVMLGNPNNATATDSSALTVHGNQNDNRSRKRP